MEESITDEQRRIPVHVNIRLQELRVPQKSAGSCTGIPQGFFTPDGNVGLVLKLVNFENCSEHIDELHKILESYPNIYYIDKSFGCETRTLIQISDACVTLHRSEGFGLVPMEAMALGTPVISTGWSGNMEYMTHMNTALVGIVSCR